MPINEGVTAPKNSSPRIILFDFEVLPDLRQVMRVLKSIGNYPGLTIKAQVNSIICCGWKEFGKREAVYCKNAWDYPGWKKDVNDDKDLVTDIRELFLGADAIVTFNGKKFDWPVLLTRMAKHGLSPLPPIPHIDVRQVIKRHLHLVHNSLDNASRFFLNEKKGAHEWELWERTLDRDPDALKEMEKYCKQDVKLLEKLFRLARPYATGIPNHNLFTTSRANRCPKCQSTRIQKRGIKYTATIAYAQYWCRDCDGWFRTDGADRNPR